MCRFCVFNEWVSDASRVVKETKFHTHFFGYWIAQMPTIHLGSKHEDFCFWCKHEVRDCRNLLVFGVAL